MVSLAGSRGSMGEVCTVFINSLAYTALFLQHSTMQQTPTQAQ